MNEAVKKKERARDARDAKTQFAILQETHQEFSDAKMVHDAAKNHMVKLLIDEGAYHCFSLNMGAVRRNFR